MNEFDREVAEIRKRGVTPKCFGKGKGNATAEQWAANLEYHKRFGAQDKRKEYRRGWYAKNRDLTKGRTKQWQSENPQRHAAFVQKAQLFRNYGILPSQYGAMLSGQDGVCAICGETCSRGNRLCVDHCHDSMAVRGLLCGKCNSGLGMFRDNPDLLRKAAEYLAAGGTPAFDIVTFYQLATGTSHDNN